MRAGYSNYASNIYLNRSTVYASELKALEAGGFSPMAAGLCSRNRPKKAQIDGAEGVVRRAWLGGVILLVAANLCRPSSFSSASTNARAGIADG